MTVNERIFNLMERENIKNADLAKHLNVKNNVIKKDNLKYIY